MPNCEKNIQTDFPLNASVVDPDETVLFTTPGGVTYTRKYSVFGGQRVVRYVFDWAGADGTVLETGLTDISVEKIIEITRTGKGVRDIIEVPPTVHFDDVQWASTGDLTVNSGQPMIDGEYIVIITFP